MTNGKFSNLFDGPVRQADQPLTQHHMDVAASIQAVLNEAMLRLTRSLAAETGMKNLCLAGGVALNCVANGKVLRDGRFDNVWIQPAAGDAGGAIGAALAGFHIYGNGPRRVDNQPDAMKGAYLGPSFDPEQVRAALNKYNAVYRELDEEALFELVTAALTDGEVVAGSRAG